MSRFLPVLLAAAVACSGDATDDGDAPAFEGPRAFVSPGSDAYVGVAANEAQLSLYVCDGTEAAEGSVHLWFEGNVDDADGFDLTHSSGAAATGSFDAGDGVTGRVTLEDGTEIPFDGTPVDVDADDEGLFRGEGEDDAGDPIVAGWVVVSAEDQRGSILFAGGGSLQVVSRLPPGAETVDVDVAGIPRTLTVKNRVDLFR